MKLGAMSRTGKNCSAKNGKAFGARAAGLLSLCVLAAGVWLAISPEPVKGISSDIVISQLYGGGGNTGATLRNDFMELFNRGSMAVNITGWSIQYASSSGTTWLVTPLSGTIQPGQYFLIQQAAGAGGTQNLPTPDATGTTAMSATSAKVALVNNATTLSGSCPTGSNIVDFVGYGAANCFEGSSAAPGLSNTSAALRANGGCQDTDVNSADFASGAPAPRNTSSPINSCSAPPPPPPPLTAIHTIQGNGSMSPLVGQMVTTTGIVTGLRSNGFFLQEPDASADSDPMTSEGILVFTSSAPPAAAAIGNMVQVTGTVTEFIPGSDSSSPSETEITGPSVMLLSMGHMLPAPITLTAADTNPNGGLDVLERFEGMRVFVPSLTVTGPTLGSVSEANATSTSNGVFYGVITGVARPFREPGVQVPDPLPAGAPCCVPRFDGNPERIRVDSDAQPGATAINVTAGAVVMNITGPLDYAFRTYTILPDAASPPGVAGNVMSQPLPAPNADEFTVGALNLQRFFDTTDDPMVSDAVLTPAAFDMRLAKASLAVRNIMQAPDVLGVAEMENLATLQALAARISLDAVTAGQPDPAYSAHLVEGNDVGGIDVGFLVKSGRVNVRGLTQIGKNDMFISPTTMLPVILHDRPPLMLEATVAAPGYRPADVTVIMNHLRSLSGVDTSVFARTKRQLQSEAVASLVQSRQMADPNERIVLIGDYNAYEFNDGYVDVMGAISGMPAPMNEVVQSSPDLVNPDLLNLLPFVAPDQRYSYNFDGNAQVLDHVLISQSVQGILSRFHHARIGSDFPEVFRNDAMRPERITDHDGTLAYLRMALNHPPLANAGPDQAPPASYPSGTATVTLDGSASSDADGDPLTYEWRDAANSIIATTPMVQVTVGPGTHTFTLKVSDGLASSTDTVNVTPFFLEPKIDALQPSSALAGGTHLVTLTGMNFTAFSTTVNVTGGEGVQISGVQVLSPTQLTMMMTIDLLATGNRKISVTTPGGTSNSRTFQIKPLPFVASISPGMASAGTTIPLYVNGSGFIPGAQVNIAGTGVQVLSTSRISDKLLIAQVMFQGLAMPGPRDVSVTTANGTSNVVVLTIQ